MPSYRIIRSFSVDGRQVLLLGETVELSEEDGAQLIKEGSTVADGDAPFRPAWLT